MKNLKKSSFCNSANCVTVDSVSNPNRVIVYDEFGDRCVYTFAEWNDFIKGVKNGEFDI